MTDVTAADLVQAIDRTMVAFRAMADKVMSGRVTWANIQAELTGDELAVFWALMRQARRERWAAAERIGRA